MPVHPSLPALFTKPCSNYLEELSEGVGYKMVQVVNRPLKQVRQRIGMSEKLRISIGVSPEVTLQPPLRRKTSLPLRKRGEGSRGKKEEGADPKR